MSAHDKAKDKLAGISKPIWQIGTVGCIYTRLLSGISPTYVAQTAPSPGDNLTSHTIQR